MKIISVFNNKGGVGKTTLTFHVAHALAELGKKVLLIDLDPQCNLTIISLDMEEIHEIWEKEDQFIDDFNGARSSVSNETYQTIVSTPRSVHFLLKPTEDGTADFDTLPPPISISPNVDLIPGRLTLHLFEAKIAERWSGIYQGDPLAIRTATRVRSLSKEYTAINGYDFVIFDTSPSLGALNRDLLSLYGLRNIGSSLKVWQQQFESIFHFLSDKKREQFPDSFVQFLGYTIYNAKKYTTKNNPWNIAQAHYNYARQIPDTIAKYISEASRTRINIEILNRPIGGTSLIHTHNTLPSMAQKYHKPMWVLPTLQTLEPEDRSTILGNQNTYLETKNAYHEFTLDFMKRISALND